MFKLLLKYLLGLIFIGIISLTILYFISQKMLENSLEKTILAANQGVFYSLQTQLKATPQNELETTIEKIRPGLGNSVQVIKIADLSLNKSQLKHLLAGNIVITTGKDIFYLGYGVTEVFTYQRINNSNYALQLTNIPILNVAERESAWMMQLITLELQHTPRDYWQDKIKILSKTYGVPLTIFKISDKLIPASVQQSFKKTNLILGDPDAGGRIIYAYFKVDNDSVIRIGPIPYSLYPQYQIYILIVLFLFIAVAFIILLAYIFSRNLDKIYQITHRYSHGDFSPPPTFNRHSTLYTLYMNIINMGNRIQHLMTTQHNLTRFVAHECRTPVSTMLFAIDALEKQPLSVIAKENISSIKADLAELNQLVGDFLSYARFTTQDLKLEITEVDINAWLQNNIDKFKQAPKKISLQSNIQAKTLIKFDQNLFKHVINNLLSNALKHTNTCIQMAAEISDNNLMIHIDDDGAGINTEDKENIFSPFVQLENTTEGFGLGLAIAEAIVTRHHGKIEVTDSKLGGTRFSIYLPI